MVVAVVVVLGGVVGGVVSPLGVDAVLVEVGIGPLDVVVDVLVGV